VIRPRTAVLLTLGLLAPLALVDAPAGALDQDLVASSTSGPPGTVVTLSSASCTPSGDQEAYLDAQLFSGTEPDLKLAGVATGSEGSVTFTIPDWVDPDQPATFVVTCYRYDPDTGEDESLDFDPLVFDVEPGAGAPVQVPTFSRTSLLSGQGTLVSSDGCGDASRAFVVAQSGTDLSGRSSDDDGLSPLGFGEVSGGAFDAELAMTNTYVSIGIGGSEDSGWEIDTSESPNSLAPGSYSVFPYCISPDGESALVLEPSLIELTGVADTTNVDLSGLPSGRPDTNFAGVCSEGDVAGSLDGESVESVVGEPILARTDAPVLRHLPGLPQDDGDEVRIGATGRSASGADRMIPDGGSTDFTAVPDEYGQWSVEEVPDFDAGYVTGFARCGDTLGSGFFYDAQVFQFDYSEPPVPPTTTPTTVPTTSPASPSPATAVPGTPTYAG
jgi:hypothetical protein